ncbi:non-ribosomal peptide synthetase [Novispirillum itersonii]|uniref:L-cysteine--[L-cysteinyl-carrier protein] ligase n=1 Tax=Novispirillum itersonii TaxID=189 RepID=A0A7W9ZIN5_NOVIT|nr:non-ribosomal peptide synthetase [Novispirillum itersonii]MBB6212155.1 amino acid adenylation domain-containing protein [Novispirillum itersonii]
MTAAPDAPRQTLNADWLRQRLATRQAAPAADLRVSHDAAGRFRPFPMTDMQQAYWLGRDQALSGGGAMQMYLEFDSPEGRVDLPRLEAAWNRLLARHDMLRAVVTADGQQQVLPDVPYQTIERHDLSALPADSRESALESLRTRLLADTPPLDRAPQSRLVWTRTRNAAGQPAARLHMRLDMWCFDGRSFQIVIEDLAALYDDPAAALKTTAVTFRDYVMALKAHEETPAFAESLRWWQKRLETLPPPPPLPYVRLPQQGVQPKFRRLAATLSPAETDGLKALARQHGLGLPGVMATAYASALSLWSGATHFTLNVPRFNRPDWHPDLTDVIGEFASFSLLEIQFDPAAPFREIAGRVQQQLWTDLEHGAVSGVRQLRERARQRGTLETGAMPIVFTTMPERRSAEARRLEAAMGCFGSLGFSLSFTPQVWIDSHYFELDGTTHVNWDTAEGLFAPGLIEGMFESYEALVRALAAGPDRWQQAAGVSLPPAQASRRQAQAARVWSPPASGLLDEIATHLATEGDRPAVFSGDTVLSRRALRQQISDVVSSLRRAGIAPGDVVGLHARRGADQVAAALGILFAGAVYMPLDTDSPAARLSALIRNAGPKAVLTDAAGLSEAIPETPCLPVRPLPSGDDQPLSAPPCPAETLAVVIHTSGSTGVPKGVMLPWRALHHVIQWTNRQFALTADDRAVMVTAFHHDLSLYDLLGPLAAGGGVITLDPDQPLDPASLRDRLSRGEATLWNSVPRLAEALLTACGPTRPAPLRRFVLGGDWVPPALPQQLYARWPQAVVTTIGGPTETTIWNILADVPPGPVAEHRLPYGTPMPGCTYRILDASGRDCPDGVAGEMACGGASLALGYLNQPEETRRRFLTDPVTGERLYLTGDRGRFRPDDQIEILGRTDFQLNVGGYRADPAGIEAVLTSHPLIGDAVVVAAANDGTEVLAAYYTLTGPDDPGAAALLAHAAGHLPPALLPKVWIRLDALPLTGNGKVDRRALSDRPLTAEPSSAAEAPVTALERTVATVWADILGQADIGRNQAFFALGGDSIAATRVIARLDSLTGVRLSIGAFFASPTVQAQAAALESAGAGTGTAGPDTAALPAAFPVVDPEALPLSWAQERLWFLDQLAPGAASYLLPFCTLIDGPLDPDALRQALQAVVHRHSPLRTLFPSGAGIRQWCMPAPHAVVPFRMQDLRPLSDAQRAAAIADTAAAEAATGFDLSRDLPVRAVLLRETETRWHFFCTVHHIAFDGWSIGVFNQDLYTAYHRLAAGADAALPAVAAYAAFARWQRDRQSLEDHATGAAWWRGHLAETAPLTLYGDQPSGQPAHTTGAFPAATHTFQISQEVARRAAALAADLGTTVNVVLLTAFAAAFGRYEGQDSFIIGTAVAGRDHPLTEDMVGFFVKNLPLPVHLTAEQSFAQSVSAVHGSFVAGVDHLDLSFQEIVSAVAPVRDPGRNPLFQVAFTYQNAPLGDTAGDQVRSGDLLLRAVPVAAAQTHLDFDLLIWPGPDGLRCHAVYAAPLFSPEAVARRCQAFSTLLEAGVEQPGQTVMALPLSPAAPETGPRTDTPALWDGVPLWTALQQSLARTPQALWEDRTQTATTGPDLLDAAARLDAVITTVVPAGQPVALWLDPGVGYVSAILACMRRGSPYALLDPMLPAAAVAERLKAAALPLILTTVERASALPDGCPALTVDRFETVAPVPPRPALTAEAPVAMVWTSGSTGTPKAPVLSQAGVVNRLLWDRTIFRREEAPRGLLKTAPPYGDSIAEVLQPLLDGFPAVIPDPDAARTPSALLEVIRRTGPTRLVLTPSLLRALLEADPDPTPWPLHRLHLSGEPLPTVLLPRLKEKLRPEAVVLNIYGSSEVTADVTAAVLDLSADPAATQAAAVAAIGRPLPGCTLWLLDATGQPVPPGAVGEIHVAGVCLALGYHQAPDQTALAFRDWTAPDGTPTRLYATGDLARQRPDGALVHLGRKDGQIKIRGVRIEPAEIEARLLDMPGIRAAVVGVIKPKDADPRLVAWIEAREVEACGAEARGTAADLPAQALHHLRGVLPPAFLPAQVIVVQHWPTSAGGKVLKSLLPLPELAVAPHDPADAIPANDTEALLVRLWQQALGHPCGLNTSFFEAGGTSLSLAEMHRRLVEAVGQPLPLVDLFRHPTIRTQGQWLSQRLSGEQAAPLAARSGARRADLRRRRTHSSPPLQTPEVSA